MKKIILFLFAFLLFPIGNVFGVTQTNLGDDIFVFVQTSIRNSDGVLAVYLESSKFASINATALDSFLDYEATRGSSSSILIDGKQYQIIQRMQSLTFNSEELVASTILADNFNGEITILARFAHDGYTASTGDIIETIWTFVRPVS